MVEAMFHVKVHAGDKHNMVVSVKPNAFAVWVRAKPEQGRANEDEAGARGRRDGTHGPGGPFGRANILSDINLALARARTIVDLVPPGQVRAESAVRSR